MTNALLVVTNLTFSYGGGWLLKDWSLSLDHGITWLRGPNGAGKTTILRIVGGALEPLAGALTVAGVDRKRDPVEYRRRVFLCMANVPALPWLTAHEFVDLHLSLYRQAVGDDVVRWLKLFQINHVVNQRITALSLGQQRKLHLAVALALRVDVLLLDEPFNGLDARSHALLEDALADPARVSTQCIVISSHASINAPGVRDLDLLTMDGYHGTRTEDGTSRTAI